jgi:hypothetical protein
VTTTFSNPGNSAPLAFGEFLGYLKQQGFTIGVDHHLRLHHLLSQVGEHCAPHELKTLLCPIFATSEREQELFYRAFDLYFDLFRLADKRDARSGQLPTGRPGTRQLQLPDQPKWRSPLAFTALALAIIILAVILLMNPEVWKFLGLETPSTTVTPPVTTPNEPAVTQEQTPQPTQVAASPIRNFVIENRNAIRIAAVLLPLLIFLLSEWWRWHKRKLILEKARGRKPPFTWPVRVDGMPELKDYRSDQFYRAARWLRRRQIGEFQRLDVGRTIAATIESRGYPAFRYRPDSRVPEYLILIDRESFRDHQARLFDSLARAMEREGIFLARYFYDGDPRICRMESADSGVHLTDLQKKYSSHRLLLFGDGEKLLDPITGRLASWTALLQEWPERAVMTPVSRSLWGWREKVLAGHFIVLPATLEGLAKLAESFELPGTSDFPRWDQSSIGPPPPDTERSVTITQLRDYLGEDTFQWLCACAVYPELQWDLTLYLGSLPCMGKGLISERYLLRLIRLHWFRTGSIPDEMRLQLIGELDPAREHYVRSAIIQMLEKNPAPQGTFAADAQRLDIAAQKAWLERDDRKKLQQAVDEIRSLPQEDLTRDYTLVRFLEEAPGSRLAVLLPQRLRKLFYEDGIPGFGLKTWVRAWASGLLMIAVWFGAGAILPEGGSEREYSSDSEYPTPQIVTNASPGPTSPSPSPTQAPAAPQITITPRSLNFGNLEAEVGQVAPNSVQRRLQIRNTGTAPLRISNITLTSKPLLSRDSFSIANRDCVNKTLNAGQSCSITINFVTRATGRFSTTLIINSNAADSPHQVTLSGNGVEPGLPALYDVNPDSLNFGEQQLRTRSNPRTVTLTNQGKSTISVVAVTVSSSGPSASKTSFDDKQVDIRVIDFAISRDNCTKRTLNPGSSCTVGVVFIPQSLTTIRGTLTINLRGISARVALRGVGVSRRQTTN